MPGLAAAFTLAVTSSMSFQDVQLEVGALGFFGLRLGVEAGLHVVLAAGGKLLDAFGAHVMIGEGQAVGGDERARAAVIEAHGGEPGVVEPSRVSSKPYLALICAVGGTLKSHMPSSAAATPATNKRAKRIRMGRFMGSHLPPVCVYLFEQG